MSQVRNSDGTVDKVLVCNKDIVVESSEPSSSSGDEAGTLKGLVKSKQGSTTAFLKGSSKVYATGKKVVPHLTPTKHNGGNLPGGGVHCAPSQTKVLSHV